MGTSVAREVSKDFSRKQLVFRGHKRPPLKSQVLCVKPVCIHAMGLGPGDPGIYAMSRAQICFEPSNILVTLHIFSEGSNFTYVYFCARGDSYLKVVNERVLLRSILWVIQRRNGQ